MEPPKLVLLFFLLSLYFPFQRARGGSLDHGNEVESDAESRSPIEISRDSSESTGPEFPSTISNSMDGFPSRLRRGQNSPPSLATGPSRESSNRIQESNRYSKAKTDLMNFSLPSYTTNDRSTSAALARSGYQKLGISVHSDGLFHFENGIDEVEFSSLTPEELRASKLEALTQIKTAHRLNQQQVLIPLGKQKFKVVDWKTFESSMKYIELELKEGFGLTVSEDGTISFRDVRGQKRLLSALRNPDSTARTLLNKIQPGLADEVSAQILGAEAREIILGTPGETIKVDQVPPELDRKRTKAYKDQIVLKKSHDAARTALDRVTGDKNGNFRLGNLDEVKPKTLLQQSTALLRRANVERELQAKMRLKESTAWLRRSNIENVELSIELAEKGITPEFSLPMIRPYLERIAQVNQALMDLPTDAKAAALSLRETKVLLYSALNEFKIGSEGRLERLDSLGFQPFKQIYEREAETYNSLYHSTVKPYIAGDTSTFTLPKLLERIKSERNGFDMFAQLYVEAYQNLYTRGGRFGEGNAAANYMWSKEGLSSQHKERSVVGVAAQRYVDAHLGLFTLGASNVVANYVRHKAAGLSTQYEERTKVHEQALRDVTDQVRRTAALAAKDARFNPLFLEQEELLKQLKLDSRKYAEESFDSIRNTGIKRAVSGTATVLTMGLGSALSGYQIINATGSPQVLTSFRMAVHGTDVSGKGLALSGAIGAASGGALYTTDVTIRKLVDNDPSAQFSTLELLKAGTVGGLSGVAAPLFPNASEAIGAYLSYSGSEHAVEAIERGQYGEATSLAFINAVAVPLAIGTARGANKWLQPKWRKSKVEDVQQTTTRAPELKLSNESFSPRDINFEAAINHVKIHTDGKVAGSQFNGAVFETPDDIAKFVRGALPGDIKYDQSNRAELTLKIKTPDGRPVGFMGIMSKAELEQALPGASSRIQTMQRIPGGEPAIVEGRKGAWFPEMHKNSSGNLVVKRKPNQEPTNPHFKFEPDALILEGLTAAPTDKITVVIEKDSVSGQPVVRTMFPGKNAPEFPVRNDQRKQNTLASSTPESKFWDEHVFLRSDPKSSELNRVEEKRVSSPPGKQNDNDNVSQSGTRLKNMDHMEKNSEISPPQHQPDKSGFSRVTPPVERPAHSRTIVEGKETRGPPSIGSLSAHAPRGPPGLLFDLLEQPQAPTKKYPTLKNAIDAFDDDLDIAQVIAALNGDGIAQPTIAEVLTKSHELTIKRLKSQQEIIGKSGISEQELKTIGIDKAIDKIDAGLAGYIRKLDKDLSSTPYSPEHYDVVERIFKRTVKGESGELLLGARTENLKRRGLLATEMGETQPPNSSWAKGELGQKCIKYLEAHPQEWNTIKSDRTARGGKSFAGPSEFVDGVLSQKEIDLVYTEPGSGNNPVTAWAEVKNYEDILTVEMLEARWPKGPGKLDKSILDQARESIILARSQLGPEGRLYHAAKRGYTREAAEKLREVGLIVPESLIVATEGISLPMVNDSARFVLQPVNTSNTPRGPPNASLAEKNRVQ